MEKKMDEEPKKSYPKGVRIMAAAGAVLLVLMCYADCGTDDVTRVKLIV